MGSPWCNYAVYNRLTNGENGAFSLNNFETVNNLYENVFQQQNHQQSNAHLLYTAATAAAAAAASVAASAAVSVSTAITLSPSSSPSSSSTTTVVTVPIPVLHASSTSRSSLVSQPLSSSLTTDTVSVVGSTMPTVISHSNQIQSHQYFPSNSPFGILPHHFHQKPLKPETNLNVDFHITDKPAVNLTRKAIVTKNNNVLINNNNMNLLNNILITTPVTTLSAELPLLSSSISSPSSSSPSSNGNLVSTEKQEDIYVSKQNDDPKSKVIVPNIEDELKFLLDNYQQQQHNQNQHIFNHNSNHTKNKMTPIIIDDKKSILIAPITVTSITSVPATIHTKSLNFFDTYLKFIDEHSVDASFSKRKSIDERVSKKPKVLR